jgi:hypothetical protein
MWHICRLDPDRPDDETDRVQSEDPRQARLQIPAASRRPLYLLNRWMPEPTKTTTPKDEAASVPVTGKRKKKSVEETWFP